MKRIGWKVLTVILSGLSLSAWADDYYWNPIGTFVSGTTINWENTDGQWYNHNGHSYYQSGIPGEVGNAYNDNAYISNSWIYPTVSGTVPIVISNLFVDGGSPAVSGGGNNNASTLFVIGKSGVVTMPGLFTTSGTLSVIQGTGYSYRNGTTWSAWGGNATVTIDGAIWHNLGSLELSGKELRIGPDNNSTYFSTYGILNVTNSGTLINDQELRVLKGGEVNVSGTSFLIVNTLAMTGTDIDNSSSGYYDHSSYSPGSLYLDGKSTLLTQSATISYTGGGGYDLYVTGSSSWTNQGNLTLGNLDNSSGGVFVTGSGSRFVNRGLLNAATGDNSGAEIGAYSGNVQILGAGANQWATGNNSYVWLGAAKNSIVSIVGSIDGGSGDYSRTDIDIQDSSVFSSGNLKMASGMGAWAWLGADRGSRISTGDLDMASGAQSSGTIVVSRTSTLTTKNTTIASGAGSETSVIIERGSRWQVNGDLSFAPVGSGSLRVDNSELTVSGNMDVAKEAGSYGHLDLTDRARLTVRGTLSYGDGDYPDLQLNGVTNLGAIKSTKELNVTFNGNSVINGKNDYIGSTTIAARTSVTLRDADARFGHNGSVTNFGNIWYGNGSTQSTLTVDGDYTGGAGSGIHMTANLHGGTPIVDRVYINGDASGSSIIYIENAGKRGGVLEQEEIITISGNSDATFSLNGGSFYSGIYKYDLTTDGQNWLLSGAKSMAVTNAILNTAGASSMSWFTQLDNLNKRLGEVRYKTAANVMDYIAYGKKQGLDVDFWAKAYGQQADMNLGIDGVHKFTDFVYGLDLGADKTWRLDASNALTFGYFLGYGRNQRDFKGNGDGDANNYYVGFYGTWLHTAGWFADLVIKGQYTDNNFSASSVSDVNFRDKGSYSNWGAGTSLEVGRKFLFQNGLFVEPSLQASYLRLFNGSYETDVTTVNVSAADIMRFVGSVRGGWTFRVGDNGQTVQPYLRGGALEQISSGNKVQIGGDATDIWRVNADGLFFFGGAGVAWQITDIDQLHLEYDAVFGDKYDVPWNINLGYRHQF